MLRFLYFGEYKKNTYKKQLKVMGININEINQTNVILNAIYITYPVFHDSFYLTFSLDR